MSGRQYGRGVLQTVCNAPQKKKRARENQQISHAGLAAPLQIVFTLVWAL
jgi:hypothetical protein